jgi:gas vesicle protein
MAKHQSGAFLGGLLAGAAAGALAGLLLAPRRGRETRKLLAKSVDALPELVEDLATTVQLQGGRLSATAAQRWGGTLDRLREAIAAGIEATQVLDEETDREADPRASTGDRQRRYPDLADRGGADRTADAEAGDWEEGEEPLKSASVKRATDPAIADGDWSER